MTERAEKLGLFMPAPFNLEEYSGNRLLLPSGADPIEGYQVFEHPHLGDHGGQVDLDRLTAEWLKYRTFTDDIGSTNEGDKYRFGNVEDIAAKFLRDRGGRTLYSAVSTETRQLDAVCWLHTIQGDVFDYKLLDAIDQADEMTGISDLASQRVGTIAMRLYASAAANLDRRLLNLSTDRYFDITEVEAIVGRFSSQDSITKDISESQEGIVAAHPYKAILSGNGFIVLEALRNPPVIEWVVHKDDIEV